VDDQNIIFIVGAGRSGTTWLHMMLGAHPAVATGQESQLFEKYLRKLDDQWQRERQYPDTEDLRHHGITSYVSEDKFTELLRNFATGIFANVLDAKPGATVFLEKSPNNSFNIDLIARCFPGAKFIHVIRDGRDVVASVLAARKSWGRQWATKYAAEAAKAWQRAVTESARLEQLVGSYTEIRYEALLSDGHAELVRIFDFLGLPADEAFISETYRRFSFSKLQSNQYDRDVFLNTGVATASGTARRAEPKGFFRKGVAGDWQNSLSRKDLAEIYWVAGPTLAALGYLSADTRLPGRAPWSIRLRELASVLKSGIRKFGRKVLS